MPLASPSDAPSAPAFVLEPEHDVTSLLPGPNSVLAHLAERLAVAGQTPCALVAVGLLRRDDSRLVPAAALAEVTAFLARSLRGDDWLGRSGHHEYAVLVSGPIAAAEAAAVRVTAGVTALGLPGIGACAGVAALTPGAPAREILRRGTLSLHTARLAGAGSVVRHDSDR